ncbi:MAG: Clp protease N-terminal domain-containing protein, partial [Bacteroides sp.]
MNNQFSQDIQELLQLSREEAGRLRSRTILPEHLLLAMLRRGRGPVVSILKKLHADPSALKQDIEEGMQQAGYVDQPAAVDEEIAISAMSARIMRLSLLEARTLKNQMADSEHVLLAILKAGGTLASDSLNRHRVDYPSVYRLISARTEPFDGMDYTDEDDDEDDMPQNGRSQQGAANARKGAATKEVADKQSDTPALDRFGVDLTLYAKEGKLDPVVGREREIDRVAQILGRRKKNNPILVGEAGVGKTAIVEGLALRIAEERVPAVLLNKRIVMLDMSLVVAGTKFRGQFEERVCAILNELKQHDNIIVFIDEVHTLIGAGSAAGSMDAANMLKPALARGEMQCIGATTLNEYKQSIEKDSALERRFQKVLVEPSTAEETLDILHNIKQRYEEHHNVLYTEEALEACVKLTQRYISDRCFPDKAIDALDEAGSRMHLCHVEVPAAIVLQQKQIAETDNLRAAAVAAQNYELAASYRDKTKELTVELEKMKTDWKENRQEERKTVGEEEIAQVVSIMSGVPVQRVAQSEGARLAGMKQELQSKVIAQDAAIDKVTKAILRSRLGLKDPNRPIGTFLFL